MTAEATSAQCMGKHAFDSFESANRARPQRQGNIVAYHCQSCSQWHLGAQHVLGKKRTKGRGFLRRNR